MGWRFATLGYLPQPMYFRPQDSLMDLFATARWANTGGAYVIWHSVYPPLSFVVLKLVSVHACYAHGGMGRGCDWRSPLLLLGAYLGNLWLLFASFRRVDGSVALPRTIVLALSLPMLFALERGNLVVLCLTFVMLAYGGFIRSKWGQAIALSVAVNLKPYILLASYGPFAARDWGWFPRVGIATVLIWGASFLYFGEGSIVDIVRHETDYYGVVGDRYFTDLYFATSFWPLVHLLRAAPQGLTLLPPIPAHIVATVLELMMRGLAIGALACAFMGALNPGRADARRVAALAVGVALTAFVTGSAGYTQIFLLYLVFLERERGGLFDVVIACAYLLCLPIDLIVKPLPATPVFSYLGGREVLPVHGLAIGQFLRPALLLTLQAAMVAINLRDVAGRRGAV